MCYKIATLDNLAMETAMRPPQQREDGATQRAASSIFRDIEERAARLGITPERVLEEIRRIAFSDLSRIATWQPGENGLQVDVSTAEPSSRTESRTRTPEEERETSEQEGSVKWYSAEKAFGFIGLTAGGKDVFVHRSAIIRSGLDTLSEGQPVIVKFVAGQRGPEAVSIRLIA